MMKSLILHMLNRKNQRYNPQLSSKQFYHSDLAVFVVKEVNRDLKQNKQKPVLLYCDCHW